MVTVMLQDEQSCYNSVVKQIQPDEGLALALRLCSLCELCSGLIPNQSWSQFWVKLIPALTLGSFGLKGTAEAALHMTRVQGSSIKGL